jgi:Integrase core domain
LHVCIDDPSHLVYSEILPDEKKESAIRFLGRALAWFGSQGVSAERVMTDNGSAYRSKSFRVALTAAGARRKRTRPYTPRTNGKAEPFIQTSLRGWAYAQPYASSQERSGALMPWLRHYNTVRPHAGLVQCPPAVRLKSQLLGSTKGTVAPSRTAPHDDRRRKVVDPRNLVVLDEPARVIQLKNGSSPNTGRRLPSNA